VNVKVLVIDELPAKNVTLREESWVRMPMAFPEFANANVPTYLKN
jgi:hypothetical protein